MNGCKIVEVAPGVGIWSFKFFEGEWTAEEIDAGLAGEPTEVVAKNLLVNAGLQNMLDLAIGAGGTAWTNANAYIGVGDSSASAAASQTDLQASTNRVKRAMDATFPSRSGQTVTFRVTFSTSEANFVINEAGVFNGGPSFGTGTMLNRVVQALGEKTSASTLQVTVTVTFS